MDGDVLGSGGFFFSVSQNSMASVMKNPDPRTFLSVLMYWDAYYQLLTGLHIQCGYFFVEGVT